MAKKTEKDKLKPSVLAYERKLECSNAFFNQASSKNLNELKPVKVIEKAVRGTISNRLKDSEKDPIKLNHSISNANPQQVEVANLDEDKDTLITTFTLKILPFDGSPCTCNSPDYREKIVGIVADNFDKNIPELSRRYACNIANGRWLWRNRVNAESIRVIVSNQEEELEIKDAKKLSLVKFEDTKEIKQIASWIEEGLRGDSYVLLTITAYLQMGKGQEVFPSEEMVLDKGKQDKSKILYKNEDNKAGLHSQKIGNAIRTIDNWYDDAKFPISVEPYGSVTTMGMAFRNPSITKQDFYTLLDNWIEKDQEPEKTQQHFVFAMLIRGGVFGQSGKE